MKSFSTLLGAERYAALQRIAWLLELEIGGEPWLASNRALTFDGQAYPARMSSTPRWRMQSHAAFGPGGLIRTRAEVRIADTVVSSDPLRDLLKRGCIRGAKAWLRLLWMDEAESWVEADAVVMLSGSVAQWRAEATGVVLELTDQLGSVQTKRIGRVLVPSMVGSLPSELIGEILPIVIGRHQGLRLEPLLSGAATRLAEPLATGDGIVALVSTEDFAPSGTVQVGEELIEYDAIDSGLNTIGTLTRPVTRGQAIVTHPKGEPARWVPPGGFEWLVADHPCASVSEVKAGGLAVDAGQWATSSRALGGQRAQVVTMSRWPTFGRFERIARRGAANDLLAGAAYSVGAGNTALNPLLAVDTKLTSTAARLAAGSGLLSLTVAQELAAAGREVGRYDAGAIHLRYSASRRWAAGSQLLVRFVQGASSLSAAVPRPDSIEGQGSLVGGPGEPGGEVETTVAIHEFELSLAAAIDLATGWGAFDAAAATEIEVEFIPDGDATEILIHGIELEVGYFAQLTSEMPTVIVARVDGWMGELGQPIENPADVLDLLLTEPRFAGLSAADVDESTRATVAANLGAQGYAFARRIAGGTALEELLESAAREAGLWLRFGAERIGFATATAMAPIAAATERLDAGKALDRHAEARLAAGPPLTNDCLALVAAHTGSKQAAVWDSCPSGGGISGLATRRKLKWLDGKHEGAHARLGALMRAAEREPFVLYEQSYPLGTAMLEPGDAAEADWTPLGIETMPGWVERIEVKPGGRVRLELRCPEAGDFCWQASGETYLRTFGFGRRVMLVVEGIPIVSLEQGGELMLAGRFSEEAGFTAGAQSSAISFDGTYVYWSVGTAGSFTAFARIDAVGNFELNGKLREESGHGFLLEEACFSADASRFRLASRPQEAGLEFEAGAAILHLAGRLTEEAFL